MKNNDTLKIFSLENLINKLFTIFLTITIVSSVLYIFTDEYFNVHVVLAAVMTIGLYSVYDYIYAKKKLSSMLYVLLLIIIMLIVYNIFILQSGDNLANAVDMVEWFFSGGESKETKGFYLTIITLLFTFFISSVIYYFTYAIYRSLLIVVISLIPCALFVKVSASIPASYLILLVSLNIFIYLKNNHTEIKKATTYVGGHSTFINNTDFALAAIILALLIPKPADTPYYEKFEEMISRFTINSEFGRATGKYLKSSGNADNMQKMDDRLIYIVSTNNPVYFKVQVFNIYNKENRYWSFNDPNVTGHSDWEKERTRLSLTELLKVYKKVYETNPEIIEKYGLEQLVNANIPEDTVKFSRIRTSGFTAEYLISPMRAVNIKMSENSLVSKTYRTLDGEIFPDINSLDANEIYNIEYYDDHFLRTSGWLQNGGCNMTINEFDSMIIEMKSALKYDDTKNQAILNAFFRENSNTFSHSPIVFESVSREITSLAYEITDGLVYDWQKAEAIEQYFYTNGFTYDLAYRAPQAEDTPEYFLFTSKRGTCSDFATAYCLLARAAGLTIRYAEGYVPQKLSDDGIYEIRTINAHAYPEVYIAGAGWQIYEPTIPDLTNSANGNNGNAAATDTITLMITALGILISIAIFVGIMLIIPVIAERLYRLRIRTMKNNSKAAIMLMHRYSALLKRLFAIETSALTALQIGEYSKILTGENADEIIHAFTKACYSSNEVSGDEKLCALKCYVSQYTLLKNRRKTDKKKGSFKYTNYSELTHGG